MTEFSKTNQDNQNNSPPEFLVKAIGLINTGQRSEAIEALKQGESQNPFTAYSSIGEIHLSAGENEEALQWLLKAQQCSPDSTIVSTNISRVLIQLDRTEEAVEELAKVLKLQRNVEDMCSLLEELLLADDSDRTGEVICQMAGKDFLPREVIIELAKAFYKDKKLGVAEILYKKVLESGSEILPIVHMSRICQSTGRPSEGVQYLKQGVKEYPDKVGFWHDLGNALVVTGKANEGVELLKKGVEKEPENHSIHSDFLLQSHYLDSLDSQQIFEEHNRWGQAHAPLWKAKVSHTNIPDPHRKLRIGYISPDFCVHSVAYFFEPILDGRNHAAFEVYAYGNVSSQDSATERIKNKVDCYRDIYKVDDQTVLRMIEDDKIDILVDLAGHTGGNRLPVMANKPAPIQVSYLGYPDTTGMKQIEYRLTDNFVDSQEAQQFHTEELVFLPNGFLCYLPPDLTPPVAPLPACKTDFITFGSFNNNKKISHTIMELWGEILKANKNSVLMLKFAGGADQQLNEHYVKEFGKLGISSERLKIIGRKPHHEHFQLYGQVDIALDTYPYHGTTTTYEALWMGVPVVSLVGDCHISRVANSILTRAGLQSFIASNPKEYVEKANLLASDIKALAKVRASLRGKMIKGGLCDAGRITSDIEAAYREIWQKWCRSQGVEFSDSDVNPASVEELVVDNIKFKSVRRTKAKNNSVGYSDRHIIKIEHEKHPWKLRTFSEEIGIIKYLNSKECVSCPRLISDGTLETTEKYFIQQRIDGIREFNTADMVFSMLEQKNFGVCQGDFKRDNLIFDRNSVCYMIDYDQAIRDDKFINMTNVEYLKWYDRSFAERWNKLGFNFTDSYAFGGLNRDEIFSLFKDDAFNLGATTIFKEQITTNTESGIYHNLNTDKLYIEGARDLTQRCDPLNDIEFKEGEKVLDIGCNMGLLSHYLHDRGCSVTGVDMDEKIIIGAKMVANILGKNIKYDWLDLDTRQIEEDYDTICLFSVIHHVKNFKQTTENISQKCNRIILECALKEYGSKPVDGMWVRSSGWEFNKLEELTFYLELAFKGFKFQKTYGDVDRKRVIMTFVKEPATANIESRTEEFVDA